MSIESLNREQGRKAFVMRPEFEEKGGERIKELFMLRSRRTDGRIRTSWGSKTLLGVFACVARIVDEQREADRQYKEGERP